MQDMIRFYEHKFAQIWKVPDFFYIFVTVGGSAVTTTISRKQHNCLI